MGSTKAENCPQMGMFDLVYALQVWGDEVAFREKYGLGNSAGEYAIHGGGVPIRVTGVEGVVAVVVVSGLKQDEDHGVIVEVIRELYY